MKLLRFGPAGQEKPGVLDEQGQIRDLSGIVADFAGAGVSLDTIAHIDSLDLAALPLAAPEQRIGACLGWVPNFYCIGLNYARHAAEAGMDKPQEPILFSKAASALSGPFDPVVIPEGSEKTDWEAELGVIIGRPVHNISQDKALSCVAGYCTVNDISERAWQLEHGGQWIKGKSAPTFGPVGPYIVTADEVPDPQALAVKLSLNGETMQDSGTADMIFGVAEIIAYMSRFMTLLPGDLISTGTPEGVGMGANPPRFLRAGDEMTLEVGPLGAQRLPVVAAG